MRRLACLVAGAWVMTAGAAEKDVLWFTKLVLSETVIAEYDAEVSRVMTACKVPTRTCLSQRLQPKTWKLAEVRSARETTAPYTGKVEAVMHVPQGDKGKIALKIRVVIYKPESEAEWIPVVGDPRAGMPIYIAEFRGGWIQLPEWLSAAPLWMAFSGDAPVTKPESAKGNVALFTSPVQATNRSKSTMETLPPGAYFFLSSLGGKAELRAARRMDLACPGGKESDFLTPEAAAGQFEVELDALFADRKKPVFIPLSREYCR